jgi:hypothetical protein
MQSGYCLCTPDLEKVLCLSRSHEELFFAPVDGTKILNHALCLSDITEGKNILRRLQATDRFKEDCAELEVHNVARLYNKFF